MHTLSVSGDHFAMGFQQGYTQRHLRAQVEENARQRLRQLQTQEALDPIAIAEVQTILQDSAPSTLRFLRGVAQGLGLDEELILHYALASYLEDRSIARQRQADLPVVVGAPPEGCTVWAATGSAVADGSTLLVKNRDYRFSHLPLQVLVHARPERGYAYTYVTSIGSPAVFSSGMNEAGMVVADTHVVATDCGPGLPRYTQMQSILEQCRRVDAALDYLRNSARMGLGNLMLADAEGNIALAEVGFRHLGVRPPQDNTLVATNHFTTPELATSWIETNRAELQGNSVARQRRVEEMLAVRHGRLTPAHARRIMREHCGALASLCRHDDLDPDSGTISTVIFQTQTRRLWICHGSPCTNGFRTVVVQQSAVSNPLVEEPQAHEPLLPQWLVNPVSAV